jgi:hypothetical protein
MSGSAEHSRSAGARFLRFARHIYSDATIAAVFSPAVADLQEEIAAAGASRIRRALTWCRWSGALLVLAVVVAVTMPSARTKSAASALLPHRSGGWFLVVLAAALYGGTWQFFGWFVAAALPFGAALAVVMRSWHNHHPLAVATSARPGRRDPEINLSAIHVAGDVAGLMFAVGSVVIVLVGLPTLWWFVAAVGVGSVMVAFGRHHSHDGRHAGDSASSIYHH